MGSASCFNQHNFSTQLQLVEINNPKNGGLNPQKMKKQSRHSPSGGQQHFLIAINKNTKKSFSTSQKFDVNLWQKKNSHEHNTSITCYFSG
jgi:hypothetical protein